MHIWLSANFDDGDGDCYKSDADDSDDYDSDGGDCDDYAVKELRAGRDYVVCYRRVDRKGSNSIKMSSSSTKTSNPDAGYNYLFKLVLAGSSGVGKTSMLMRYVEKEFSETFISTIGVDFKVKTEEVLGARVKLQMWDTAGQDRFRSVASNFYRCAHAIIIVFDVRSAASFADVEGWVSEARRYGPPESQALLVGNKADAVGLDGGKENEGSEGSARQGTQPQTQRQVDEAETKALADRLGMNYFETSAKTGHNIAEAFISLAETLVKRRREENGGEDPVSDITSSGGKQGGIILNGNSRTVDGEGDWCGWSKGICSTL
ncbi:hypothetical protein EGW08_014231 [Elysia chlorotica]|uniref:Uncharacterized protein n=1 Tax=Elysia chlorotica TaxID=188477 RepID=A0A3S1BD86_ELYCH|nr:hypothetical protein EGW08_014231 [Elysia chlorotica]